MDDINEARVDIFRERKHHGSLEEQRGHDTIVYTKEAELDI